MEVVLVGCGRWCGFDLGFELEVGWWCGCDIIATDCCGVLVGCDTVVRADCRWYYDSYSSRRE